tara:strand:- start:5444 stop:6211 length:768 start_codon:yes stop_codon:yes gene_type:complete
MIDSHCHLDHQPLSENLDEVLNRSKNIGIEKLLTISTTNKSLDNIIKLVNYDPIIYGTFGIHPHEADKDFLSVDEIIKKASSDKKIIGIGESGLDFYYNNSKKKTQIDSFKNHIEASIKLNIPLIVHSRNAEIETFDLLNEFKNSNLKILMHCFTGSTNFAKKLFSLNTFFSASGIITFKNSNDLQETFKLIPNDKLLIETDSPFLAPIPMRGKKNEPSFLKYTLEKLADLKNLDKEDLDSITTNNFNKLFFNAN